MKANLFLSIAVAFTGICLPIGLSFSLLRLANATPLQAFAAGAALCSTSLGTTFTILKTSGLTKSRLGIVLTSAAMMDDVVGLVMVQILTNLRPGGPSISATTVLRPVLVSLAFAVVLPLCCRFLVLPSWRWLMSGQSSIAVGLFDRILGRKYAPCWIQSALLVALVTGSSYAGTSNLFAAYLAGALVSWFDPIIKPPSHRFKEPTSPPSTVKLKDLAQCEDKSAVQAGSDTIATAPHQDWVQVNAPQMLSKFTQTTSEETETVQPSSTRTGVAVYQTYYAAPVDRVLKPLFFASSNAHSSTSTHTNRQITGLDRLLNPYLPDVHRPHHLARHRLLLPDGPRKALLRSLACSLQQKSSGQESAATGENHED